MTKATVFDRISAVKLGTMPSGQAHVSHDIGFGLVQEGDEFGQLRTQLISAPAPLMLAAPGSS